MADRRDAMRQMTSKKGREEMRRLLAFALLLIATPAMAQMPPPGPPPGPPPTQANIAYAPAEPAGSQGHLLDLYLPQNIKAPVPVVIWTGGSAWMADNGKITAGWLVPALNRAGYAVAGVSIRSISGAAP